MARSTTFLSEQKLKEIVPIDENVDPKITAAALVRVHDMYILPILGTALFEDIKTKIEADETLAGYSDYATLIQSYLQPCIAYYTLMEALPDIWQRIKNTSVVEKSTGASNASSWANVEARIDKLRNVAEYYAQRAINYLITTATTSVMPLYWTPGTTLNTVFPKVSMYSSGIYLGESTPGITREEFTELYEQFF